MSAYYPVFLDLADGPVLVVGGGPVAEGKVEGLLAAGANVTVVSPTVTPRLECWVPPPDYPSRGVPPGDSPAPAPSSRPTNRVTGAVAAEGRERGICAMPRRPRCATSPARVIRGPAGVAVFHLRKRPARGAASGKTGGVL